MRNNTKILPVVAGAAVAALAASASAQTCQVIFAEDFDSIPLGQNVMEGIDTGEGGVQDNVWTPDLPTGWSDFFACPGDGVTEWQGFNIADGAWWNFTCGDQRRSDFTVDDGALSQGACLIADPDEWDDFNRIGDCDGAGFNAYADTPAIDLTGVTANTVTLNFYSSWRDEDSQTAYIEVSFDGGTGFTRILEYSSDPNDPNFKDDAENEIVSLSINNPDSGTMIVRFGMSDAGNDWWWAVDDIAITAESTNSASFPPAPFLIDAETFNPTPGAPINWAPVCGADDYVVELAKDADFTDVRFSDVTPNAGYVLPGDVPSGIYYARVIARNAAGDQASTLSPRIVLDNPCLADVNGDGQANTLDFLAYLNSWTAGCP